jgi:ABC-2 type transport system ATP-binding protein
MKRRVDLAAALIHNPVVLFLDEPTTGLDPISRSRIWEEVRNINRELGMTIFLTTQYLEEADALAHRVGIIDRGVLAAEGTPADLKRARGSDLIVVKLDGEAPGAAEALMGIPQVAHVDSRGQELTVSVANGAALISSVALALAQSNIAVQELTLRTPTLDDVFLQVTGGRLQDSDNARSGVAAGTADH